MPKYVKSYWKKDETFVSGHYRRGGNKKNTYTYSPPRPTTKEVRHKSATPAPVVATIFMLWVMSVCICFAESGLILALVDTFIFTFIIAKTEAYYKSKSASGIQMNANDMSEMLQIIKADESEQIKELPDIIPEGIDRDIAGRVFNIEQNTDMVKGSYNYFAISLIQCLRFSLSEIPSNEIIHYAAVIKDLQKVIQMADVRLGTPQKDYITAIRTELDKTQDVL